MLAIDFVVDRQSRTPDPAHRDRVLERWSAPLEIVGQEVDCPEQVNGGVGIGHFPQRRARNLWSTCVGSRGAEQ